MLERVGPNSFRVDVPAGEIKIWPHYALQVVHGEPARAEEKGPTVDKKVVRAQRMEARNVSPEEVKEALAAPAQPRSMRAKKIDYRALAGLTKGGGTPSLQPTPGTVNYTREHATRRTREGSCCLLRVACLGLRIFPLLEQ